MAAYSRFPRAVGSSADIALPDPHRSGCAGLSLRRTAAFSAACFGLSPIACFFGGLTASKWRSMMAVDNSGTKWTPVAHCPACAGWGAGGDADFSR